MDDMDVDQQVRSALAAGTADAGPHPEPDALFHYYAGELSSADADGVQGHLASCPACARAVIDFETFPHLDAPSDDDVPSIEDVEAGWADLQARLRRGDAARGNEAEAPERGLAPSPPASARPRGAVVVPLTPRGGTAPRVVPPVRRAPVGLQAAAAVLAATTLGLGGYAFVLQRALTQAAAPTGGVFQVDLDNATMRGAATAEWKSVIVPAWARVLTLNLSSSTDLQKALPQPCHVEIVRVEPPGTVWSGFSGVDNDVLTSVHWPRASAPAGRYRAVIRAAPAGPELAEFKFELIYR